MTSASLVGVRGRPVYSVLVSAVALVAAVLIGTALAVDARIGIALLLATCTVPLVLLDLSFGIALWAALLALSSLPVFGLVATAAGLLTVACWIGVQRLEQSRSLDRVVVLGAATFVLLLVWLSLSLSWAEDVGTAAGELARWSLCGLAVAVLLTSVRNRRDSRLVIGGFVVGIALSVLVGVARDGLGGGSVTAETLTSTEGRLKGGLGDPNILAAAIVPAVVMGAALGSAVRRRVRWGLLVCVGVLVVGLAATESRGGAVAAAAALGTALVVMRRERKTVLAAAAGIALVGGLYLAAYPQGLDRLTSSDGGSGRSELWRVAWRITTQHPVTGVGLHNFTVYSPRYVREPGPLKNVDLIADRPHAVHNTYLELLAETGVIGLGLFLVVIGCSLRAALKAARGFEARGDQTWGTVARAAFVATVGALAAAFFVTLGSRLEFWLVLALGPVLLAVSRGAGSQQSAGMPASADRL
jgi:O-antigen ligase